MHLLSGISLYTEPKSLEKPKWIEIKAFCPRNNQRFSHKKNELFAFSDNSAHKKQKKPASSGFGDVKADLDF